MRGTLVSVCRTGLVVVGFVILFGGIVTLAYPPLLSNYVFAGQSQSAGLQGGPVPGSTAGPTLQTSLVGIIWGLTLTAAGLAIPGRASWGVREQPFTRRQRLFTLVGALFVVGLPVGVGLLVQFTGQFLIAIIPTVLLALVGCLLVLVGASNGLKYTPSE